MKRHFLIAIFVAFTLLLAACSSNEEPTPTATTANPEPTATLAQESAAPTEQPPTPTEAPPQPTDTPASEPQPTQAEPTATPEAATPEPTATSAEGVAPPALQENALSQLDSYRGQINWHLEQDDGTVQEATITVEETKDPAAQHMVIDSEGQSFELIDIEGSQWVKVEGQWQQLPGVDVKSFLGSSLFLSPSDVSSIAMAEQSKYEFVGDEEVNGIQTRHYHLQMDPQDLAQTAQMTDIQNAESDVWIANAPDLPEFAVRLTVEYNGQIDGQGGTATISWEITNVNSGLTIEPPA